jgi:hypothetical protein
LSLINPVKKEDPVYDLILRLLLATRLDMVNSVRFSEIAHNDSDDAPGMDEINTQLCSLSLQYAIDALYTGDYSVTKKALLFAEMLKHDIVKSKTYHLIKQALISRKLPETNTGNLLHRKTVDSPPGSLLINRQLQNIRF